MALSYIDILCLSPADSIPKGTNTSTVRWVTKWVDYSNKYGFGYQLSDNIVGVLFNNGTHMSLLADKRYVLHQLTYFCLLLNMWRHMSCYVQIGGIGLQGD